MVFPLISVTADLRPSIKKNNHRAQKMVFPLISDTADLRPSIQTQLISDQALRKNAKSNQEASSENAALKDAAFHH